MKELVRMARAFADRSRVRVLMALRGQELCVCELCDTLAVTQSTLSTHLQVIRDAGLVSVRKQGRWMYYSISPKTAHLVRTFFKFFSDTTEADATLRRDAKNLRRRLLLRNCGCCCVGFGSVTSRRKAKDK